MHGQYTHKGFSLIEFILIFLIIGVVFTLSTRVIGGVLNGHRYQATIKEMTQLKKALVGDETIIKGRKRIDFGYIGDQASFPNWNDIAGYFSTMAYQQDAWNTNYNYNNAAAAVDATSYGANGASGGSGYNEDIQLSITKDLYRSNVVNVMIYDIHGNILRGRTAWGDANYQINAVELTRISDGLNHTCSYTNTGVSTYVYSVSGVLVGHYDVRIDIANGILPSTKNWRPYLDVDDDPTDGSFTQQCVIYPKGSNRVQLIVVRLPGAINGVFLNE